MAGYFSGLRFRLWVHQSLCIFQVLISSVHTLICLAKFHVPDILPSTHTQTWELWTVFFKALRHFYVQQFINLKYPTAMQSKKETRKNKKKKEVSILWEKKMALSAFEVVWFLGVSPDELQNLKPLVWCYPLKNDRGRSMELLPPAFRISEKPRGSTAG